jgi:hypothetical protein
MMNLHASHTLRKLFLRDIKKKKGNPKHGSYRGQGGKNEDGGDDGDG